MSDDGADLLRDVTREVLAELLPGLLEEALVPKRPNGNGNGNHAVAAPPPAAADVGVPQVPAPPIAKVHRPRGWVPPEPSPSERAAELAVPGAERVILRTDADLVAFVRMLCHRLESPHERAAILAGKVRFQLACTPSSPASSGRAAGGAIRIESGAVTERVVQDAAREGARLVLSARAVLTPMARDRARSLGVEIEKEKEKEKPC